MYIQGRYLVRKRKLGLYYNHYAITGSAGIAPYPYDDGLFEIAGSPATDWNSGIGYFVGNYVIYLGNTYVCILGHTNQLPTNTTYWTQVITEIMNDHPYTQGDIVRNGYTLYEFNDWRVPTTTEWNYLRTYISTNVGIKLKSIQGEWSTSGNSSDIYKFNLKPTAYRVGTSGLFDNTIEGFASLWSSTEYDNYFYVLSDTAYFGHLSDTSQRAGRNVRCIQNKKTSESDGDMGQITDYDGNVYSWVVIGNYRWMCSNLKVKNGRFGDYLYHITESGYNIGDWNSGTTYAVGDRVIYNTVIFEGMRPSNTNNVPTYEYVPGISYWLYIDEAWSKTTQMAYCSYLNTEYYM